ncbi:MAG: type IV toxin-antitoxin system AbiEi family antitoxin [Prevotellaceae bacterium]|jgi:predicted transcriptional regulator of viral defense system|nr:type IV toxin-antitoxin system AbiEi family antitoxin [Prevotellaceae bacterium]
MSKKNAYKYLDKYLLNVRSHGSYCFTLDELKNEFGLPYSVIAQRVAYLKKKKAIAQIRQGFYVVVPPEYSASGTLPAALYIDSLMKYLEKPYYVGLLSAAALHGAAHQQPMTNFIVTQTPAPRNISNGKAKISFFSKKSLMQEGIIKKKTPAGSICVSSPELTAFDLLDNINHFGIDRIATVLQELCEAMQARKLSTVAKLVDNKSGIQRLGYMLDRIVGEGKLSGALCKVLSKTRLEPVPLSPQGGRRGRIDSKWQIIINIQVESDL